LATCLATRSKDESKHSVLLLRPTSAVENKNMPEKMINFS